MIGENKNYIYNRDRCLILEKFTWACGGKNWRHTINNMAGYEHFRKKNLDDNRRILAELGLSNLVRRLLFVCLYWRIIKY